MPNLRGGKGYKKSKGKTRFGDDEDVVFIEKQDDQMIGRLVRLLGNRNTSVYCEDKKTRICRISSGCKKTARFEVGDTVLISFRDCEISKAEVEAGLHSDRGDIIAKYCVQQISQLKKEGVNPFVFATVDALNTMVATGAAAPVTDGVEDFFDMEDSEDEAEDEAKEDGEAGAAVRGQAKWKGERAAVMKARVVDEDGDLDIDAI